MKILTAFICSIVYLIAKVKSQDVCESYIAYNGLFNDAKNCALYCCGSCNDRYCCLNIVYRLNQTKCIPGDCDSYYDSNGYYNPPTNCYDQFCCGECGYRFCCSHPNSKLNQSSCLNKEPPVGNSSLTWLYFVIGGICLIGIICLIVFISYKSKSKRRGLQRTAENNNDVIRLHITPTNRYNNRYYNRNVSYPTSNNNNAQSNTRSTFIIADNSAYNYDINKIYNSSLNDDLPPSYDTIIVQQKNSGERNETNM